MPLKPKPQGKVTRIWASVQVTVNLGNFESLKFDVGEEREVIDLDSAKQELSSSLWQRLEEEIRKKVADYDPPKTGAKPCGQICQYYLEELE